MHQYSGKTCIAINNFAICLHYHYHSDLLTTTINVGNMIESLPLFEKYFKTFLLFNVFFSALFNILPKSWDHDHLLFNFRVFQNFSGISIFCTLMLTYDRKKIERRIFEVFLNILIVQSNHVIISYCNWRDFFWQTFDQDLTGWWWSPDEWWRSPGIRRRWPKRNIEMGGKKDIGQFMGRGRHQITFDRL